MDWPGTIQVLHRERGDPEGRKEAVVDSSPTPEDQGILVCLLAPGHTLTDLFVPVPSFRMITRVTNILLWGAGYVIGISAPVTMEWTPRLSTFFPTPQLVSLAWGPTAPFHWPLCLKTNYE